MNLNTNYSHQSTNPVPFQARFVTDLPVKDAKRLLNIQDIFAKKTQHYADEVVTLAKSKDPSLPSHFVLKSGDNAEESTLTSSLNEMMESMSDNDIAKKLMNHFKMLKKEQEFSTRVLKGLNYRIHILKNTMNKNKKIAESLEKKGDLDFAARYRAIVESNKAKIDALNLEREKQTARISDNMYAIAQNDPDLQMHADIFRSMELFRF